MMLKFFFLFAVLVAGISAQAPLVGVIGTQAQSYNAHSINHAYGFAAAPVVPAYSLYNPPGYIAAYKAPLIGGRL